MDIKIIQIGNCFKVEGSINATNAKKFKNHAAFLLLYTKSLTINIDEVSYIDANGLKTIKKLFKTASKLNKQFKIIGYGSRDIYKDLELKHTA